MQNKIDHYVLNRRNFINFGLAASGLMVANSSVIAQQQHALIAPELRVPYWIDGDGNKRQPFLLNSEENKGKWVFLKCFQNWCPGCHSSGFPTLQALLKKFGTNHPKITFAGIQTTFEGHDTNDVDALRPLQERYNAYIPFGHDEGDPELPRDDPAHFPNTMVDYRTRGTPWLILITPERVVIYANFHVNNDALIAELDRQFRLPNS